MAKGKKLHWPGWSDWTLLKNLNLKDVPKSPGAYAIAALTEVKRVVGGDPEGILHIGESGDLRHRIKCFRDSAGHTNTGTHSAGWRYRKVNLHKIPPFKTLYVSWIAKSSKAEATEAEAKMLTEYTELHYELPPLNYKFNWALDNLLEKNPD